MRLETNCFWNFCYYGIFRLFFFFFSNLENRESLNFSRNNRTNYNAYITFFVFTFAFSLKSRMAVINISDGRACTQKISFMNQLSILIDARPVKLLMNVMFPFSIPRCEIMRRQTLRIEIFLFLFFSQNSSRLLREIVSRIYF